MTVDTFQQLPVAWSESRADSELAEDQARQPGLSRVMDETNVEGLLATWVQRQHMVAELAEQHEERDHERTDAALAAAASEGMPPRTALPRDEPAASGPTQRRRRVVRHAGWLVAGLAMLSIVVVGSVFLLRQRRH
jgi:predicted anti-sigma-YlaC factor YlaD